jgi:tRNA-splicing endonuclease subunit Sen34
MKFGGDFLAYPGDPMVHHAEFIIVCEDIDKKIHTTHIIAHARLASIVKKTFLIAFIDATDTLKYKPVSVPYLN